MKRTNNIFVFFNPNSPKKRRRKKPIKYGEILGFGSTGTASGLDSSRCSTSMLDENHLQPTLGRPWTPLPNFRTWDSSRLTRSDLPTAQNNEELIRPNRFPSTPPLTPPGPSLESPPILLTLRNSATDLGLSLEASDLRVYEPSSLSLPVALRTQQRHASRLPPTPILSFSAWPRQFGRELSNNSLETDDNSVDNSPGGSQHGTEYSRPSKRPRSSTGDSNDVNIPVQLLAHSDPVFSAADVLSSKFLSASDPGGSEKSRSLSGDPSLSAAPAPVPALSPPSPNTANPSLSSSPPADNVLPNQTDAAVGGVPTTSLNSMQGDPNMVVTNEHRRQSQPCQVNPLAGLSIPKPSIQVPSSEPGATPSNQAGSATRTKPSKLMIASSTALSARNLFAIDYLKDHSPTKAEFKQIWDTLSAEIKKKYELLSKERKSAAQLAATTAINANTVG